MSNDVFNPNFQKPTKETMNRVQKKAGVDGDTFNAIKGERQLTFYSSLVPSKPEEDLTPPIVISADPQVGSYLGIDFFFTGTYIIIEYSETVINHTEVYNYQLQSGSHMGDLEIVNVIEISPGQYGNTRVQVVFRGSMSESGPLDILVNPDGSKNKIQDSAGNQLVKDTLSWYADLIQPWIEVVSPSPQFDALTTDVVGWVFNITFSENLPVVSGSWGDFSQWTYTLLKSDPTDAPIPVTVTAVFSTFVDEGSYGADDGSLQIRIETQNPFLQMSQSEAQTYTKLRLEIADPSSIVDRANNSLQAQATYYEWNVNYVSSDQTAPTPTLIDPDTTFDYIPLVMDDGTSNTGRLVVGFDEAVVDGTSLSNWSLNSGSGMSVNAVAALTDSELSTYGVVDGYVLSILGQSGTAMDTVQVTPSLADASGNAVTSSVTKSIERKYPRLVNRGVTQGTAMIGYGQSTSFSIDILFDTPVKTMTQPALGAFWGIGKNLTVQYQGTETWESSDVIGVIDSIEEVVGLDASNPQHILAHRLNLHLETGQGSTVPEGSELFRVFLDPQIPSLINGPQLTDLPQMPMGFPSGNSATQNPSTYSGGWGNPLTASDNDSVYSDDFGNNIFFVVQNNREITAPTLVSSTPADGSSVDPNLSTVTLTFSEPIASYGFLEVRDNSGSVITPSAVDVSGTDIVITFGETLPSGSIDVQVQSVWDTEGDNNPSTFDVSFDVATADYALEVFLNTKHDDGTVDVDLTLGADIATFEIDQITLQEASTALAPEVLYQKGNPPHSDQQGVVYADQSWASEGLGAVSFPLGKNVTLERPTYMVRFKGFNSGGVAVATADLTVEYDFTKSAVSVIEFGWQMDDSLGYELRVPVAVHSLFALGADYQLPAHSYPTMDSSGFAATSVDWASMDQSFPTDEVGTALQVAYDSLGDSWSYGLWVSHSVDGAAQAGDTVMVAWVRKWDLDGHENAFELDAVVLPAPADPIKQYGRMIALTLPEDTTLTPSDNLLVTPADGGAEEKTVYHFQTTNVGGGFIRYEYGPVFWETPEDTTWVTREWADYDGDMPFLSLDAPYRARVVWNDGNWQEIHAGFVIRDQRPQNLSFTHSGGVLSVTFDSEPGVVFGPNIQGSLVKNGMVDLTTQDFSSDGTGGWSMTYNDVSLMDNDTYTLSLSVKDSSGNDLWNSMVDMTASVDVVYTVPTPTVTVNDSPDSWAEVHGHEDGLEGQLQIYSAAVTRPSGMKNRKSYTFEFPSGEGYEVPVINWTAKDATSLNTITSGSSNPDGSGGQSFEVEAGVEGNFILDYEGVLNGNPITETETLGPYTIDWAAPMYDDVTGAVRGIAVDRRFGQYEAPLNRVRYQRPTPTYTISMWKSVDPSHQSYNAVENTLQIAYGGELSGIDKTVPLPSDSLKRLQRAGVVQQVGSAIYSSVTVVGGKYYLNGTQSAMFALLPGLQYVFWQTIDSAAAHPFAFSTTADGTHGGGVEYTDGVTIVETTHLRYLVIDVTEATPIQLYYYCKNHPNMGAFLNAAWFDSYTSDTSLLAGGYAWDATENMFSVNLADPRTFAGWDAWKSAIMWKKNNRSDYHCDLLFRNTNVVDTLDNGNADTSVPSKGWPWLRLEVLEHDVPYLVDVEQHVVRDDGTIVDQGRFTGAVFVESFEGQPEQSIFWDQGWWTSSYEALFTSHPTEFFVYEFLNYDGGAGAVGLAGQINGDFDFRHLRVPEDTKISFVLELHYVDPLELGRLEVKLHGEHLSFLGMTEGNYAGQLDHKEYDGEVGGRLYGVPYPIKINHWKNSHNDYYFINHDQANQVGDTWRVNRHIVTPPASPGDDVSNNSTMWWPYQESGSNEGLVSNLTTWVDRGYSPSVDNLGRVIRVGLSFEPWLPGYLSVQQIPGTDQFGIPLTLEVGKKPFFSQSSGAGLAGADFISFWLVLSHSRGAALGGLAGLGAYDFVEEAETVEQTSFGPLGGHSVGTRGFWTTVLESGPNKQYGRQVKHANHVVDLMSDQHGIAISRPVVQVDPNGTGSLQPPTGGADPNNPLGN